MEGPNIIDDYWYGRGRSMLATGIIVKLIDYEGGSGVFKLGVREPLSGMTAQYTTLVDGIAAGAVSQFADFRFVEPGQEGRLFHFRPVVIAVVRANAQALMPGRILFPPIPDNIFISATPVVVPPSYEFPMGISLQVKQPGGKWRWGTDLKRDVTVTPPGIAAPIVNAGIGGQDGGFLEAPLVPFLADLDELYDIFTIFGHIIQIRLVNRTDFFWPPGEPLGLTDNKDYFVTLLGEKFLLQDVTEEIVRKVEEREIDYQPIVIAGVPQVTGQA